jgi:iron complex outermembrane receptor protein
VIDILPPSESSNAFGSARWQIAPTHQLFAEAAWQKTEVIARSSPPPISSATLLSGDPVTTSPSSQYYPHALAQQYGVDGQVLEVFWRGLELGPRTDENKVEQSRIVVGLEGQIGAWDYSTALNWADSKSTDTWTAGWSRGLGAAADPQQRPHQPLRPEHRRRAGRASRRRSSTSRSSRRRAPRPNGTCAPRVS